MLETLPIVLFIVLTEVSIGSFTVMVLLDWRNEVKRGFLISYGLIYLFLTGLTYLFQQDFSMPALLATFSPLDKNWIAYVSLPLLFFLLLMIPYNLLLWFDKRAGVQGKQKDAGVAEKELNSPRKGVSPLRLLRLLSGGLTIAAGLATLLVLAMIFRPLAATPLAGVFTVAGFFAASLALGGVLTAMWLGHWYLVTPALSERPLQFATTLVLLGVIAQVILAFAAGPSVTHASQATASSSSTPPAITAATPTPAQGGSDRHLVKPANVPVVTPLSAEAVGWIRILVSFIMPLILGGLAWKLIRDRSFQSATGMLYLVVVCSLAGEAMARGLFLTAL